MIESAMPTLRSSVILAWLSLTAVTVVAGPRYPADVVLDPHGKWIATVNEEAGSVTLIDLASGEVLEERKLHASGRASRIAATIDGDGRALLAVSERFVHRVTFLRCDPSRGKGERLEVLRHAHTGRLPAALCFAPKSGRLLVACPIDGVVLEIDPTTGKTARRIDAVEGAARLEIFERGGRQLLAVSGRTEVVVLDLETAKPVGRRAIMSDLAMNVSAIATIGNRLFLAHQAKIPDTEVDPDAVNWGLFIVNRVTAMELKTKESAARPSLAATERDWIFPLDERHRANGDPSSMAVVPIRDRPQKGFAVPQADEARSLLLVTAAGTGRLLFLDLLDTWPVPPEPLFTLDRVPELHLGGRPVAVKVDKRYEKAYVVCYLDDVVHEIDIKERKILRSLRVGPGPEEDARQLGARLFFDATRSFGDWYSCQSCHPDGATAGFTFDTLADGGGLSKKAPNLRGVHATGPWSWRGKFESLEAQIAASLHTTMAQEKRPEKHSVEHLVAYIASLEGPRPGPMTDAQKVAARRGKVVFEKSGCERCHSGTTLTSKGLKDVGVFDKFDDVRKYNPPSLRSVRDGFRYLHDGRARNLRDIFRKHNDEGRHGKGGELSDTELDDLVAFLESL
jgi:cytochrome c peroxidase/DNA-binding beta-propeller fold protein YncE